MSKSIQIRISEPCHENWQNMTPNEQGRFCGSCQKTVVDFTLMTDKELLDYFSKASQHTCGRFSNDQLNKELQPTVIKKRFTWAYVWNIMLATLLVTEANAQVKPVKKKKQEVLIPERAPEMMGGIGVVVVPPPREIKGIVLDSANNPLAGASVYYHVKGQTKGSYTDSLGRFNLLIDRNTPVELTVSYIGYEMKMVTIDSSTNWQEIKLKEITATLGDVVIVGGYSVVHKKPKKKIINDWKPAIFKNDIKIYPNPVVKGNNIKADLSLKKAGEYKMELLNVQGEVMIVQPLTMATKEQTVTIPTRNNWAPGVYCVRISAPGIKNVYQCKVSIQ
ncbi:hypothetical protein A4H97_25830 [Niastella yeongjuensis]|uniref:Secretion system C-terminal sorting domain-containing protein n=1 Tax=Niastella yeongjuensis TaxID=354355 RepID=A0A1V9F143_9BACT|nr:carboxypeptidase-like regulatory domain-containing protein [Niastella yeongjuensis]OQP52037.1 hypothetical protein A4H97_25830 [Niastella yeongjuensis]SEP36824.1 Por secretion system C-terminal sorting domain-containing protein [Niastella yeongjuensis]